ncbi:hypothetical protein [Candidatus Protofrankia californiensis]|uniref:hypothetical protein n=1 Tax=Candidatus Protofrankia californiensis TaxID=1839754 RepID=UPI0010412A84|nr:hypothetical protein [Candidatus Protofrankia californiensis]
MVGEPEIIAEELNKALKKRRGVRAIALHTYARELALLLCPEIEDDDRANAAEQLIRRACAALGHPTGRALEILCAFASGTDRTPLQRRREEAGNILSPHGIQADTVRRPYIWDDLMLELAIAIRGLMAKPKQEPASEFPDHQPADGDGEDNPAA